MKTINIKRSAASKFWLASVLTLTMFSSLAFAGSGQEQKSQHTAAPKGVRLLELVLDYKGKPLQNATVRVCADEATETPCTPLADLFSNDELTIPAGNPTLSDQSGKMAVYVPKGRYHLQISADGMKTFDVAHVEAGSGSKSQKKNDENDNTVGNVVILSREHNDDSFGLNQEQSKIAPDLSGYSIGRDGSVDVVVQFKQNPNSARYAEMLGLGTEVIQHLDSIKGMALRVPVQALSDLLTHPEVAYVSPDRVNKPMWDEAGPSVLADVARTQYGLDGSGIGIAVVDSGVYQHGDLQKNDMSASRIVYSESFVPGDTSTNDAYGHGTHVAGIVSGNGRASAPGLGYRQQYFGIAPNANIINLRVLDGNGGGSDSQVIAAINRAVQLKNTYNIRVLNLSLGRPVYESYTLDPLCQAVESAWKAGIVVVVAAGNMGRDNSFGEQGYATIEAPGNDPNVITVGATNTRGTYTRSAHLVASYSSKGPTLLDHIVKPDLVAPGNMIVSLLSPGSTLGGMQGAVVNKGRVASWAQCDVAAVGQSSCPASEGAQYLKLSGTSMATPVVSGGAALMIQKDPTLTPDAVKARLMKDAFKGYPARSNSQANDIWGKAYVSQYDVFTIGSGYLDLQAALADNTVVKGGAPSPTAVFDPVAKQAKLVNGLSIVWGQSVVWGQQDLLFANSVVWGQLAVDASSLVWGNSVVWGQDGTSACSMVWGQSVVWGQLDDLLNALSAGDPGDTDPNTPDPDAPLDSTVAPAAPAVVAAVPPGI